MAVAEEGTVDFALGRRPKIGTDAWQWGSLVVVGKVPYQGDRQPLNNLWRTPEKFHDVCGEELVKGTNGEISEALGSVNNFHKISRTWFSRSGNDRQFLVSTDSGEVNRSKVPTVAFHEIPEVRAVRDAGVTIAGISRTRTETTLTDPKSEYIAIHLSMSGRALEDPTWVPAALHRPSKADEPRRPSNGKSCTGRDLRVAINKALKTCGLELELNFGGGIQEIGVKDNWDPIYVISMLAPSDGIPDCQDQGVPFEMLGDNAQLWAHAMSLGRSATPTPILSDLSEPGVAASTVSLGPIVGWCSDRGMGLVAQRRPQEAQDLWVAEVAHAFTLGHSVFVDLAVLTMQQENFLKSRTKSLSEVATSTIHGTSSDEEPTTLDSLRKYKDIQKKHIEFLGQKWIQEIPGRMSASRVLRAMQSVRMLEERIKHSVIEQRAVIDYLEAAQAEKQAEAAERKEKFGHLLNYVAFIFLPATLIFTITGGLGVPLQLPWAIICGAGAIVLTIVLIAYTKLKDKHQIHENSTGTTNQPYS